MSEQNDLSVFGGSVDRSKLDEMKKAAGKDPDRQAQVAEVQAQVDAVAESDAAAEKAHQDVLDAQADTQAEQADDVQDDESEPEGDQAPPRAGAGSGRDAWAAYAESQGVEVTDDMTRDEIIAATEE